MIGTMAMRVAAGIWFVFAVVTGSSAIRELLEDDLTSAVLGAGFATASAWVGYRLLRSFTRDIAVVAACLAAVFVLLIVSVMLRGDAGGRLQVGIVGLALAAVAGYVPYRQRPRG